MEGFIENQTASWNFELNVGLMTTNNG